MLAPTLIAFVLPTVQTGSNQSPDPPTILEPGVGQVLNPADVHMVSADFSDPDVGDLHAASDWEIWSVATSERVWAAYGVTGISAVHIHLGDGVFEGPLAGASMLTGHESYELRTRHQDSSGDQASEWSAWSTRTFGTGIASSYFPLQLEQVAEGPTPVWEEADGTPVELPAGTQPGRLLLESPSGSPLLEVQGEPQAGNLWLHAPELRDHVAVRARLVAGDVDLVLPASRLTVYEHGCEAHRIHLPAVDLAAGAEAAYWISSDGVSFHAPPGSSAPAFEFMAAAPEPPWVSDRPGFVVETVATGFSLPVDIAFVPQPTGEPGDPLFYVSELYGTIRVVTGDGTVGTYAAGLLNFSPSGVFPGSGEVGLTGLAVEPATGDVFASMLYDAGGGVLYPKVTRFTSADGGLTALSQSTVLDLVGEEQGPSHMISNLHFMDDGTLLVHVGDGFVAWTAQAPTSFRGKVLRVLPDGSPAPDNPLYDEADGIDVSDHAWSYGLRNPFGGDVRDADGLPYAVENGPWTDRIVRLDPGANLGWNGLDESMQIGALHTWSPAVAPVDLAFAQSSSFGGGGFPAELTDRAYISLSGSTFAPGAQIDAKQVGELDIALDGTLNAPPTPLVRYVGSGRSSASGLAFGPDGLYFATLYADAPDSAPADPGASILRIRHVGIPDANGNGIPDDCEASEQLVRLGVPANPAALQPAPTPPTPGALFDPWIDHGSFVPGAVLDGLGLSFAPDNADLPPFGTLLLELPTSALHTAAPGASFGLTIPALGSLVGLEFHVQGFSGDATGSVLLTNALDVTVGSY